MPDLSSELHELDNKIAALESLRGKLSDAMIDADIATLRTQNGAIAKGRMRSLSLSGASPSKATTKATSTPVGKSPPRKAHKSSTPNKARR